MKRIGAFLLLCALVCCLFGCTQGNYADVTPNCDAIQNICFQRTNIDENDVYTYFEKNIAEKSEVESLCASLDKIKFVKIDPVKFSSADYLIVFEGKKTHKLMVSKNQIIYDGLAYEAVGGKLTETLDKIYGKFSQQEVAADSKLFK